MFPRLNQPVEASYKASLFSDNFSDSDSTYKNSSSCVVNDQKHFPQGQKQELQLNVKYYRKKKTETEKRK